MGGWRGIFSVVYLIKLQAQPSFQCRNMTFRINDKGEKEQYYTWKTCTVDEHVFIAYTMAESYCTFAEAVEKWEEAANAKYVHFEHSLKTIHMVPKDSDVYNTVRNDMVRRGVFTVSTAATWKSGWTKVVPGKTE